MGEPRWIPRLVVEAIHRQQVGEHGGLTGIRDEDALESAIDRPRNRWHYGDAPDLADLAAAYGFGLARNHPFRDGNKRVAFLTMVTFLGLNGVRFQPDQEETVALVTALARGSLPEEELAGWIRARSSGDP